MSDLFGELTRGPDFIVGRLTRRFDQAPGVVWRTMTDAESLSLWLAAGRIDLNLGGAVRLEFEGSGTVIDSEVLALEDGALLEFSWSNLGSQPGEPLRPVRWELAADGAGSRLTVTVKTPHGEDPGRACAGWEAHLAMLAAALAGAPIGFPFDVFKAAREGYKPKVAALGA
jgi:uncharacterized protein YndB with AHSA1/START domain